MNKQILFVIENLGSGGAEQQLTRLSVLFKEAGYDSIMVTWGNLDFHNNYLAEHGIKHIKIPAYPKIKRIWALGTIIRRYKTDTIISYLPMSNKTVILAQLIAPVRRLIVSERSFTKEWNISTKLKYFLYQFADKVVPNSNNEAQNIISHCPNLAHKVISIPNLVETTHFMPQTHNIGDPIRLVSVGRVIPSKNVLLALHAFRKILDKGYNCTFDWYGNTYDKEYLKEIKDLCLKLKLKNKFNLKGETKILHQILPQYDLFLFPSLLEGYPNVLCEAMACSLPIASSNTCEMPYILTEGKGGYLFNPQNINEMVDSIEHLLKSSNEELHKMGKYNHMHIIKNNSPQNIFIQYLNLL